MVRELSHGSSIPDRGGKEPRTGFSDVVFVGEPVAPRLGPFLAFPWERWTGYLVLVIRTREWNHQHDNPPKPQYPPNLYPFTEPSALGPCTVVPLCGLELLGEPL
jgi:hypothetical protein